MPASRKPLWLKIAIAAGLIGGGLVSAGVIPSVAGGAIALVPTLAALFHDPPNRKKKRDAEDDEDDEENDDDE